MDELTIIASDQPERLAMAVNRHSHRVLALFEPLLDHQNILRQIVERRLGDWLRVALLDLRVLNAVRERAFARLERLPKRDRRRRRRPNAFGLAFNHARRISARNHRKRRRFCRRRFAGHRRTQTVRRHRRGGDRSNMAKEPIAAVDRRVHRRVRRSKASRDQRAEGRRQDARAPGQRRGGDRRRRRI